MTKLTLVGADEADIARAGFAIVTPPGCRQIARGDFSRWPVVEAHINADGEGLAPVALRGMTARVLSNEQDWINAVCPALHGAGAIVETLNLGDVNAGGVGHVAALPPEGAFKDLAGRRGNVLRRMVANCKPWSPSETRQVIITKAQDVVAPVSDTKTTQTLAPNERALETALRYAAIGLRVFPVNGADKQPAFDAIKRARPDAVNAQGNPAWPMAAASDPDGVRALFSHHSATMVGLPMGPNGSFNLVAIDCDRHPGKPDGVIAMEALLAKEGIDLTGLGCPIVQTPSNGQHWFFTQDGGYGNGEGKLPEGVNVRGAGGYVVAEGSVRPDGRTYAAPSGFPSLIETLTDGVLPPELPDAIRDKLPGHRKTPPGEKPQTVRQHASTETLIGVVDVIDRDCADWQEYEPWLRFAIAVAVLAGGDPEVEAAMLPDPVRTTGGDRSPGIFARARAGGLDEPPGAAIETACCWMRDHTVPGREDDARKLTAELRAIEQGPAAAREEFDELPIDGDDKPKSWVEEINESHAVIKGVSGVAQFPSQTHGDKTEGDLFRMIREQDFRTFYSNRQVEVPVGKAANGVTKTVLKPMGAAWLNHARRRQYEGLGLFPQGQAPAGFLNLWCGLGVEPVAGRWDRMADYLQSVICAGDAGIYEWLLDFLANWLQHPLAKGETNLALIGGQGTGKSTLGHFLRHLFGRRHSLHVTAPEHLVGRFNGHLEGKLFVLADEAFFGPDRQAAQRLKTLTTEKTILIEGKGLPSRQAQNSLKLLFASNSLKAVPADMDDRRTTVLDVSNARMQDNVYFERLCSAFYEGGEAEAFLHDMLKRDLSQFNPRTPLATAIKSALKLDLANPAEAFIVEAVKSGDLPGLRETSDRRGLPASDAGRDWTTGPVEVLKQELYAAFERYCDRRHEKYPPRAEEFGRIVKTMLPGKTDTKPRVKEVDGVSRQATAHRLPRLGDCRAAILRKLPGIDMSE